MFFNEPSLSMEHSTVGLKGHTKLKAGTRMRGTVATLIDNHHSLSQTMHIPFLEHV